MKPPTGPVIGPQPIACALQLTHVCEPSVLVTLLVLVFFLPEIQQWACLSSSFLEAAMVHRTPYCGSVSRPSSRQPPALRRRLSRCRRVPTTALGRPRVPLTRRESSRDAPVEVDSHAHAGVGPVRVRWLGATGLALRTRCQARGRLLRKLRPPYHQNGAQAAAWKLVRRRARPKNDLFESGSLIAVSPWSPVRRRCW